MNNQHFWGVIVMLIIVAGCKRENPVNDAQPSQTEASELKAPDGFNFSYEKTITVNIAVADAGIGERFVIKIYGSQPHSGSLITTGFTNADNKYATSVRIPSANEYIWIERIAPTGIREQVKIKAEPVINHMFTGNVVSGMKRKAVSGLDCNSYCTVTYNNHSGSVTVGNGQVACFTGTINSNIVVNGDGRVKICASGTITGLTLNNSSHAYILENTVINAANINQNGSGASFHNWSDSLKVSGSVSAGGYFENLGKMYVNGDFNINSGASYENYGKMLVSSNFNVNATGVNYSFIVVNGTMNNNSNGDFKNHCNLDVKQNLTNNGLLYNGRLIKCGLTFTQNSGGKTSLDNIAQVNTKNLMLNGTIEGTGTSKSLVKVAASTTINSSGRLKGYTDICDLNGIETNNGAIQAPAAQSCGTYIPTCPCNTEGFGTPQIVDADGDGVPDNQDEYPYDANRAFNSYYPCFNVCYTLAFEDLWPSTGDYDYNDMVIKFTFHKVLNAANKVIDLNIKVQPVAVGASYDNGFGIRLDEVLPSAVSSVTGQSLVKNIISRNSNGTEAGQERAVIILFDSPEPLLQRAAGSMFNTVKSNPRGSSEEIVVKVTFETPVEDAQLDMSKLNPFIFTNQRRGYEIHLPDYKPTSLADAGLFGTSQDRTNPALGKYYRTANNMPWAVLFQCDFDYPAEKVSITSAYNFFDEWVISGGSQYPNWYRNFPAYRNNDLIY